ncbi:hypothetical protein CRG98_015271 [Punica granatum]|uniref:Uncharacterized protein n=1 Tax=Punica granatum TaxID=22663 RepID=A0A2I0K711_PUNGR|nr:hypothetical protein CRG98_015271 [Punica granatum]
MVETLSMATQWRLRLMTTSEWSAALEVVGPYRLTATAPLFEVAGALSRGRRTRLRGW